MFVGFVLMLLIDMVYVSLEMSVGLLLNSWIIVVVKIWFNVIRLIGCLIVMLLM